MYNYQEIEKKWQEYWDTTNTYVTKTETEKKKFYMLVEFPYPSGVGLHVGHARVYTASDVQARFKKARGYNVLFPMGWDAFGAPAEQYAIKNHIHPKKAVEENIQVFKGQMKSLGLSVDWSREFSTTDPEYYKWTQWQFLQFYKAGLAYKDEKEINWCPKCKTGLSNEDAQGGVCERCGTKTTKKLKNQWLLRMSNYADKLLDGLKDTEFLDKVKTAQVNWIGKSVGALVKFPIKGTDDVLEVFTTRCDTLFGVTFMVISPEHSYLAKYKSCIKNIKEVEEYQEQARQKSEIERTDNTREKTGVKLEGLTAINPVNGEEIEIWVSDYVLASYGTGAIMAVPAHDERDYAFAKKFGIPIRQVIAKSFVGTGESALRENQPITERQVVNAVIKHPTEEKYLCVRNRQFQWLNFVMGGIEESETTTQAAIREVVGETGYDDIEIEQELNFIYYDNFYAAHKKVNRHITCYTVVGRLNSLHTIDRTSEEKALADVEWISKDKVLEVLSTEAHKYDARRALLGENAYVEDGVHINSGFLDGLEKEEAIQKMINYLEEHKLGKKEVNYRLQDWIFSRQRFWGEPIPMINCPKCGWVSVPEKDLPVLLPDVQAYEPTEDGESPLATIESWVNVKCPCCGEDAKRETDTMPNWAGSSWYWLRYMDPHNQRHLASIDDLKYWGQVDLYDGGMEHATRHLLYARFWNIFLHEQGLVPNSEPFLKRISHGMILGAGGEKMSKSKGNVVNPNDMIRDYGADALRVYEMFIGDYAKDAAWSENGLKGCKKFLNRIWNLQEKLNTEEGFSPNLETIIHKTIKKVTEDIESLNYNTAVSSLMILLNEMDKQESISKKDYRLILQLLNPFAPHITEELNQKYQLGDMFTSSSWPTYDQAKTESEELELAVQINGKVRGTIRVKKDEEKEVLENLAKDEENVKRHLDGKEIIKVIVVPNRIVNIVAK